VDVLVNNGGYGAVMTALNSGIPVVVAGYGQDKLVTNNLVEYTGVGVSLRSKTPSMDAIREGVNKILGDGKYKRNSVMMSRKFEEYDVGAVFDKVIQGEVMRWTAERGRQERVIVDPL
jgi:UDP:flavonoid glycosyltransferase YjiC (YdhE family)